MNEQCELQQMYTKQRSLENELEEREREMTNKAEFRENKIVYIARVKENCKVEKESDTDLSDLEW